MRVRVCVCRQARTPQEVAAYSQFRLTGFFPTLRAYWRMDEGSGAAVPDMSGNGHEAEMVRRLRASATTQIDNDRAGVDVPLSSTGRVEGSR